MRQQQVNRIADMGDASITRLLLRFSLPSTLAMLVMASYNIVDAAFVGRLGSDAIAALSIAFPLQMVFGALAIGTGVGAASLISRSLGAEKNEDAVKTIGQVFLIALILGVATTLIGQFLLEPLLVLMGATPEILALTMDYMKIIINWSLLLFLIMMLNHTVRAEGNALLSMAVIIVSAVVNIILDPIFIFVLDMGITGAAVATVIAKAVGVAALLWYYLSGKSSLKWKARDLLPDWPIIIEIYKVGLPTILIQVSQNFSLIIANRLLGSFGYVAIAVMGLVYRLLMFAMMPVIGIAQGLLPVMGYNYGAGKLLRVREALIKGTAVSTILITITGVSFWLFPEFFLRIFSDDESLLAMGKEAVRIMVIMWPLLSVPLIGGSLFQAIGKGLPALLLSLMRQFIAYIPLLLILPRIFDLTGIWLAGPISDLLTFTIAVVLIAREFKHNRIPLFKTSAQAD